MNTDRVLAGDTTNKMAFLGGEEGAALCIALLCTIVLRRRLSSKKRSLMYKTIIFLFCLFPLSSLPTETCKTDEF
jgi:hypothetical protein